MPVEADVHKLRNFILEQMHKLETDQFRKWDAHDFIKMRNLIVSRLTMFNARRGGEPARLTLEEWKEAVLNMSVEGQYLSKYQTVERILECPLFTLGSDALRLKTLHTPRRKTKCDQGSPTKAVNLKVKQQKTVPDPRPVDFRNRPEYSHQFRGALLNFSGTSKMPISHLFRPANIRAVVMDHSYAVEGPVDHFLRSCGLIGVSAVERESVQGDVLEYNGAKKVVVVECTDFTNSTP
ncbi:hypothetical protein EGW08_018731 [Elysia chlorotica]|uniref:Uncharacterized protein n=1 Tax=Elysia chlorotica TaxID=188477 RepID=A0A3S1B2L5_ELYCH|nr:hypothetical protein EGW08_018731 [Elysia chlorotica]